MSDDMRPYGDPESYLQARVCGGWNQDHLYALDHETKSARYLRSVWPNDLNIVRTANAVWTKDRSGLQLMSHPFNGRVTYKATRP